MSGSGRYIHNRYLPFLGGLPSHQRSSALSQVVSLETVLPLQDQAMGHQPVLEAASDLKTAEALNLE
jgi:hypothetical protein